MGTKRYGVGTQLVGCVSASCLRVGGFAAGG